MLQALRKRIIVAGFIGSHLCRRLVAEGNDVLCVDNFYTGTRDNIVDLLASPRFELLRHDVTFPLYIEPHAAPRSVCGPISLGNPKEFIIRQLADTLARMCQTEPPLEFGPLPADDPPRRCPDINRTRELLGWKPAICLADGLAPTIEYFKRFV